MAKWKANGPSDGLLNGLGGNFARQVCFGGC